MSKALSSRDANEVYEVDVLTSRNLCIGPLQTSKRCGCISFWLGEFFPGASGRKVERIKKTVETAWKILGWKPRYSTWFTDAEDEGVITPRQTARVMNLSTALMGFTEGNPEAGLAAASKSKLN